MAAALLVPWVIRLLSLSLVLICCSTWLYSTSCWVKVLESIGLVGSWFFNWVVSSDRKVEKLPDSWLIALALLVVPLVLVVDGVEVAEETVMAIPGCPTAHRAARDKRWLQWWK